MRTYIAILCFPSGPVRSEKILTTFKFLHEGMEFLMSVKKTAPILPDGLELPAGHETIVATDQ